MKTVCLIFCLLLSAARAEAYSGNISPDWLKIEVPVPEGTHSQGTKVVNVDGQSYEQTTIVEAVVNGEPVYRTFRKPIDDRCDTLTNQVKEIEKQLEIQPNPYLQAKHTAAKCSMINACIPDWMKKAAELDERDSLNCVMYVPDAR